MTSEKVTFYRTNEAKTEVIEQLPKTITSQVYDHDKEQFLDTTIEDINTEITDHNKNETDKKHIEVVSNMPTNMSESGIVIKVDGSHSDVPGMVTVDELQRQISNITDNNQDLNRIKNAFDNKVLVEDFNIAADGTTDNTTALQAMIDYVHSLGGGIIELPTGVIKISSVTLKENVQLVGVSKELTTFLITRTPGITMQDHTAVKNVFVKGDSETYFGNYTGAIWFTPNTSNQLIESCKFSNFYTCVYNQNSEHFTVRNCVFECHGLYGLYLESTEYAFIEGNTFNCHKYPVRPICFQFYAQHCYILNNKIFGKRQAITGILFMNHQTNYNTASFCNRIIGNEVRDIMEEGISFDMMMESEMAESRWTGGRVASATNTTLTDSSKSWTSGKWYLVYVLITSGKGEGQIRQITASTANSLTVDRSWNVTPDSTSTYIIGNFGFDNIISNNIVDNCDRHGILLYGCNLRSQITSNIVSNCGWDYGTSVYEWGNIGVVSCEANEIRRLRPAVFNLVADNIISKGKTGIIVESAPWSGTYTPIMLPSNTIVKGNLVQDMPTGIWVREGKDSFVQNNSVRNTTTSIKLDTNTKNIKCIDNLTETSVINQGTNNTVN